jgi:ATP-binding cassette, subfamily G (WHITE), member 2, SNQ2
MYLGSCLMNLFDTFFSRSGLKIMCKPDEFAVFNPPSGQTCAAWASDFVKAVSGYIDNPDDTAACRYCQYSVSVVGKISHVDLLTSVKVGDEFFLPLNIKYTHRWRDVGILFCFFGTFVPLRY